jgi:small subunit ribosomal protein S18
MANLKRNRNLSPIDLDTDITYKDINLLKSYTTSQGKILPRRTTRLTVKQQRRLTKAIKQARILNLLPFVLKGNN